VGDASNGGTNQGRLPTPYAFGYIFGFADALIQRSGITDDVQIMAALTVVHTEMFGTTQGARIFGASILRQTDPQFAAGRTDGGTEALKWLSSGGKWVPSGLTFYLTDSPLSRAPRGTASGSEGRVPHAGFRQPRERGHGVPAGAAHVLDRGHTHRRWRARAGLPRTS